MFLLILPSITCVLQLISQLFKALYAIGNTSLALKEHFEQDAVSIVPSMKDIFLPVCMCLDDRDDKVPYSYAVFSIVCC